MLCPSQDTRPLLLCQLPLGPSLLEEAPEDAPARSPKCGLQAGLRGEPHWLWDWGGRGQEGEPQMHLHPSEAQYLPTHTPPLAHLLHPLLPLWVRAPRTLSCGQLFTPSLPPPNSCFSYLILVPDCGLSPRSGRGLRARTAEDMSEGK